MDNKNVENTNSVSTQENITSGTENPGAMPQTAPYVAPTAGTDQGMPQQMEYQQSQPGMPQPMLGFPYYVTPKISVVHENLKKFRENYLFFILACFIYAIFYTMCMYKNVSSIMAPICALGTLSLAYLSLKKVGITLKKDLWFYAVSIFLLGTNLCMTKDDFLIFFDYTGIALLLISGLLHACYDDKDWDFSAYINGIMQSIFLSLQYVLHPFIDGKDYFKKSKNKKSSVGFYVFIGILCGLPLLSIVLLLLSSADVVFKNLLDTFLFIQPENDDFGGIIFLLLLVFFVSYAFLSMLFSHEAEVKKKEVKKYETVIAITINAMLGVFYLIFSVIQIVYLFLGKMTLPQEYTYAEYAKQGFYQLLTVCIINLVLVLVCVAFFHESKVLKFVLTVITGCTYIMILSSALRMKMYVEAYELTYLRLNVFWMLLVIFLFLTGILAYIYKKEKFSLFRYCMVVVTVLYIGYAFARPETIIARYNLRDEMLENWTRIDIEYLDDLSTDVYPIIREACEKADNEELTEEFREAMEGDGLVLRNKRYYEEMDFRSFNFSLYNAFQE